MTEPTAPPWAPVQDTRDKITQLDLSETGKAWRSALLAGEGAETSTGTFKLHVLWAPPDSTIDENGTEEHCEVCSECCRHSFHIPFPLSVGCRLLPAASPSRELGPAKWKLPGRLC